ncbi:MAG: NADPH-dependent FMN reductase [Acidimicrobiales bacterium]
MKILAIPATNSRNGINRQLVGYATRLLEDGLVPTAGVEIVDLNDYEMPIYSKERQEELGIPEPAKRLWDEIGAADAVIVSFAEHNGSYTAAWKNIHDWVSRIDMGIYQGKKVAMFAATPGPRAGAGVLGSATATAPFFGADLVGSLGIGTFGDNFDPDTGEIIDPDLRAEFEKILGALAG